MEAIRRNAREGGMAFDNKCLGHSGTVRDQRLFACELVEGDVRVSAPYARIRAGPWSRLRPQPTPAGFAPTGWNNLVGRTGLRLQTEREYCGGCGDCGHSGIFAAARSPLKILKEMSRACSQSCPSILWQLARESLWSRDVPERRDNLARFQRELFKMTYRSSNPPDPASQSGLSG
jgi:hypothetical protein